LLSRHGWRTTIKHPGQGEEAPRAMFGWFKKERRLSDAEWVAGEFRVYKTQIERGNPSQQLAFSLAFAIIWKGFLGTFGSSARFAGLPSQQQMDYFRKSLLHFSSMEENDPESALPRRMLNFYLAFLINGHTALENEAAAFLDQYARKGWEMV
jgi:hypothetical protein